MKRTHEKLTIRLYPAPEYLYCKGSCVTCCRNVPSVINAFCGKKKTALGLNGRNRKTSPVRLLQIEVTYYFIDTCSHRNKTTKQLNLVL